MAMIEVAQEMLKNTGLLLQDESKHLRSDLKTISDGKLNLNDPRVQNYIDNLTLFVNTTRKVCKLCSAYQQKQFEVDGMMYDFIEYINLMRRKTQKKSLKSYSKGKKERGLNTIFEFSKKKNKKKRNKKR